MFLKLIEKHCPKCNRVTDHVILGINNIEACSICGYSTQTETYVKNQYGVVNNKENKHILPHQH